MRGYAVSLLLALGACTGDPVETPTDAGTDASTDVATDGGSDTTAVDAPADAPADAACATVPGNLVQNPSFELAPGGVLAGWLADSVDSLTRRTGGAAHCEAWAEVHLRAALPGKPVYFAQDVRLDTPLVKGARVLATAYFRTLDAETNVELVVGVIGGDYGSKAASVALDSSWKLVTVDWTVGSAEDGATKLYIGATSTLLKTHAIGLDHVTLVITPP